MVNNFLNYSFDYFNFNFNFHCIYLHKLHYLHYTLKYLYHIKMINILKVEYKYLTTAVCLLQTWRKTPADELLKTVSSTYVDCQT